MSSVISFPERIARLTRLSRPASLLEDCGLVKVLGVTAESHARVRGALNIFLWSCLCEAYPEKSFILSDDMLRDYSEDVTKLPNVTPNGLVLPKRENQLAFNLFQKEAIAAFSALGIAGGISRVQFPVNIRLQSGVPNETADGRPRASVKPHSDIWAGDPASGILVFLSLLGKASYSGIDFLEPVNFPRSYVRTLEDYNDGASIAEGAKLVGKFDERGWFLADPYLIHRTTKSGAGLRISLDFRFIPSERVAASDIDEDETRMPWFIPFPEWQKIGTERMLITNESMHDFSTAARHKPYTIGYPVQLTLTDIAPDHDVPSPLQKAL